MKGICEFRLTLLLSFIARVLFANGLCLKEPFQTVHIIVATHYPHRVHFLFLLFLFLFYVIIYLHIILIVHQINHNLIKIFRTRF